MLERELEIKYAIDNLADEAGGYVAMPSEKDIQYLDLLFATADQMGIHYYSATPEERAAVDSKARRAWEQH